MRQKAIGRFSGLFVENRQEWKQGKWLGEYWNRPGRRGWYRDQGTGVGVLRSGRYILIVQPIGVVSVGYWIFSGGYSRMTLRFLAKTTGRLETCTQD